MTHTDYRIVACGECGGGIRYRAQSAYHCHLCDERYEHRDFEVPIFYNPQWDALLEIPELSLNIKAEVHRATGLQLTEWHTGGGCMALGVTLPGQRELLIVDGDANLPGRHGDSEVYAAIMRQDRDEDEWPEFHAETGGMDTLEDLIEFIRKHVEGAR